MLEREGGGVLIRNPKDSGANRDIRRHVETEAKDWALHDVARTLYHWTDIFTERFLRPIEIPGQAPMPATVLSFEKVDHRILAYYRLGRNPQGLLYEITMNTVHLGRPLWNVLETLLHEEFHLWQQNFGKHPVERNYHNQEFVERCEMVGLHPMPIFGFHWKPADGAFEVLMTEHGIARPAEVFDVMPGERRNWWDIEKKEGKSTLNLWECPCGQKVRVGKSSWPGAVCNSCGGQYVKIEKNEKASQSTQVYP